MADLRPSFQHKDALGVLTLTLDQEDTSLEMPTRDFPDVGVCADSDALDSDVENLEKKSDPTEGDMVALDGQLFERLPEEVLDMILERLPPAAHCRLRCVSRDWERLLWSPLDWTYWTRSETPCSIMSDPRSGDVKFFCHSEEKVLGLPCHADACYLVNEIVDERYLRKWTLVDVNNGVFCYRWNEQLAVCNPLTRSAHVLFVFSEFDGLPSGTHQSVKLLVDQKSKDFIVVGLANGSSWTGIYDSASKLWLSTDLPLHHSNELFVWKNHIYAYGSREGHPGETFASRFDATFDWESEDWDNVELGKWDGLPTKFPQLEKGEPTSALKRFIISDGHQLLLVQSRFKKRPYFSVWRLRDDESSHEPDLSLSSWEYIAISRSKTIQKIAGPRHLVQVCCGMGYICFVFRTPMCVEISDEGFDWRDVCVKYSFVTRRHCVIPCPTEWIDFVIHPWEPNLNYRVDGFPCREMCRSDDYEWPEV